MLKPGDVVLARMQFTDTFEVKARPAVVLFESFDNVVVAGITSNLNMRGILITVADGAVKDSVIKLDYIFTISRQMVSKVLFHLPQAKKKKVLEGLMERLEGLRSA
ncbi:MAG: type II toxin-antitoxin system PemK/MazF family toxin [Nanoarchaeota archaeon]